jgi:hypothetical protein
MKEYWGVEVYLRAFFDLGTRWRWVVSFTPRPLYPQRNSPWYPSINGWVGPKPFWTRWWREIDFFLWVQGASSPKVKRQRVGAVPAFPPYVFMAFCQIKHRGNCGLFWWILATPLQFASEPLSVLLCGSLPLYRFALDCPRSRSSLLRWTPGGVTISGLLLESSG